MLFDSTSGFFVGVFSRQRSSCGQPSLWSRRNHEGEAIDCLDRGDLEVIFTVDLFNEGVDIPSVDTLIFVRPTESLTVFTQQDGRGLRLSEQKTHCTIIDQIGNYRNADVKLRLFANDGEGKKTAKEPIIPTVPDECELHLETSVINLLDELSRKKLPHRERLHRSFLDLKNELGRIPTYLGLHLMGARTAGNIGMNSILISDFSSGPNA